jgi:membrane protein implicated in regulation of membrane protease activity
MDWLWWIGGSLVLAAVEMLSLDLVLIMLAGGAVGGAVTSAAGGDLWLQIVVACVVAALLLFTLRPWLLRHLRERTPLVETNAAAQVGRLAVVVSEVTETSGRVKLSGEVWSARLPDDGIPNSSGRLAVGTEARVVRIEGATAVVEPAGSEHPHPEQSA